MARRERVNPIPGAAGPLPAADPGCEGLHRAGSSPEGLGAARGKGMAHGKGFQAKGGAAPSSGVQQDQHIPLVTHLSRGLTWLDTGVSGTGRRKGVHESVKKDGNQMNNKQRELPKLHQEVRQRLTCSGFKVTAPFSPDRTVMGGVGPFPTQTSFGGRADLRWAGTSFQTLLLTKYLSDLG